MKQIDCQIVPHLNISEFEYEVTNLFPEGLQSHTTLEHMEVYALMLGTVPAQRDPVPALLG